MSTYAERRIEIFGFNLKPQTKLTQKALDLRDKKRYFQLYRVLHKIKLLRRAQA